MIDYGKLCQKVREMFRAPIENLEKDIQTAKKITLEEFSIKLKSKMKINNKLDKCIKGYHHYELTIKLNDGFELLLAEKKEVDEALVYLVYNKKLKICLGKMLVSEGNINCLVQLVFFCIVQCDELKDDFSHACEERIERERRNRENTLCKFNEILSCIEANKLKEQCYINKTSELNDCGKSKTGKLNQKVFFFCGPTGSGKTSGIAKILAPFILNRKAQGVFKIITMDTMNVGAREVFSNWGKILHIESAACSSKEELIEELTLRSTQNYIFVDLSGYSMFEVKDLLCIKDICMCVERGKLFFVVVDNS